MSLTERAVPPPQMAKSSRSPEWVLFGTLLVLFNVPLLWGGWLHSMVFFPEAVRNGEWWRVVLHPFVHLTWYHFLLDAGAFCVLYAGLEEESRGRRLLVVAACAMGSLAMALVAAPGLDTLGLCGLSGTAHGLMAFSALEAVSGRDGRNPPQPSVGKGGSASCCWAGWASFGAVAVKSAVEAWTGEVFFQSLHFGLMGSPVAVCHGGGVLAGISMFALFMKGRRGKSAGTNRPGASKGFFSAHPSRRPEAASTFFERRDAFREKAPYQTTTPAAYNRSKSRQTAWMW